MSNTTSLHNSTASNCTFSRDERNTILLATGGTAMCSVLCCVFALGTVVFLRLYNHFIYRLAMYQVLASLSLSFSEGLVLMLYNYDGSEMYYKVTCKTTAFLLEYTSWLKLSFTNWLTFHLFAYVVFFKNLKRLEWLYISSSVLGPLLFVWIPFIHNSYGLAGAWCFIRSWRDDCATQKFVESIIEQFVLFYAPSVLFLGLNILAIITMFAVLLHRGYHSPEERPLLVHGDQRNALLKQLLPLLVYPIIYFMLILFPLANRLYMALSTKVSYTYLFFHGVFIGSIGFFAGLALVVHIMYVFRKRTDTASSNIVPDSSEVLTVIQTSDN